MENNKKQKIQHWQIVAICLIICDIITIHASYFFALWIRFDGIFSAIPKNYLYSYLKFISIYSVATVVIFGISGLYSMVWRYVSYTELLRTILFSVFTSSLHIFFITIIIARMPLSYYILGMLFQLIFVVAPRFSFRFVVYLKYIWYGNDEIIGRVMIIGAGEAGQMILRDLKVSDKINDKAVCIIDDSSNKWGRYIDGIPVVGGRDDILAAVKKYNVTKIFLAIPSASNEDKRDILAICSETNCELKQLPGMYQLISGQISISAMKNVDVEDLLGRAPIVTDMHEVYDFINDKVVLVTGGGGSIGSELCRQIASHGPRLLIIFDIYENSAYEIQFELKQKYPNLNFVVLIGSVRDSRRVFDVFETYRPQIVYHAAAHKHVPLMEDSPNEAIKNNAIGTYKTAYAAMMNGCERFVLISTDKAVNPTNIMGASKRLCEMIIQSFDRKIKEGRANDIPQLFTHDGIKRDFSSEKKETYKNIKTEFVAVRFGNVLGSNGSVIPLFKKQIEAGGPVTVTHPDIIRYFMTIKEAVSLVMIAGTFAGGGEIFVLDMGSPVKIDSLAKNLIKACGFKPNEDIKIVYSGLRPGEKLYEEKLMAEEGLKKTDNDLIHIGQPIEFDTDAFLEKLDKLMEAAYNNRDDIRERVADMVSTYKVQPGMTVRKNGGVENHE